jgi:4-hydroxyacetophenone monooxygenase
VSKSSASSNNSSTTADQGKQMPVEQPGIQDVDDVTIDAALEDASIPALMAALVHLTGDAGIVRGHIKPSANVFADPQGGISAPDQARIRSQAAEIIKQFRDNNSQLPTELDEPVIREMINFMTGQPLDREYVDFLQSELSLGGETPFEQPALEGVDPDQASQFSVLVIGAGMSGILTAIKLKEAGISYTVVEKNANVGGTWFENTYPGCRVDSPNHTYSYSFAPKDWPQYYSPQPVLLDYFDNVATEHNIRDHIRFNTEVEKAEFDASDNLWQVTVRNSEGHPQVITANAVISAVGQLNRPRYPDIKGMGLFEGPSFHSGAWEHQHDLKGKKVIVNGTGASAFQFIPVIADDAAEVTVFQRTPPWVAPRPEYHDSIPEGTHWLLNHLPYYAEWFRFFQFWRTSEGMLAAARKDESWNESRSVSQANDMLRNLLSENARQIVGDNAELLDKVIPDYPPAGKRMLVDNGTWYRTLNRDNVNIVTDPIAEITATGVRTESGQSVDADVLIFGTGFQASNFLAPMEIVGRDGIELHQQWQGEPRAYLGMTFPGYPNFFAIYGPNTNLVVNGSIIFFSECEVRYILGCIAAILKQDKRTIEPRQDIHDAFNERIDEGNLNMAWGAENVSSWYKNASGRVTQNWPFSLREFWEETRGPVLENFELN